ncbi:hypothetical protein FB451DRAFT_1189511 [Mycena latifolia]|nr:hypothetical protein FB451DRAFT_1189511 [Mycena latifolia]
MEGNLANGFPGRTAFRRVHGDSVRCEGVGNQEGHPGHGFEGLLWSKCAWGANIWGPVILDGGREGAPIGLVSWWFVKSHGRAGQLGSIRGCSAVVQRIGEDGERLRWTVVVRPFREGKEPDHHVGMSAGPL